MVVWERNQATDERDPLPEHTLYRDEGCDLFPACLRCPLPQCRYDEPGRLQREARQGRDREVLRLACQGRRSPGELAVVFGMSVRTVYRILKRYDGNGRSPRKQNKPLREGHSTQAEEEPALPSTGSPTPQGSKNLSESAKRTDERSRYVRRSRDG